MSEETEEEERRLLAESQGLGDLPDEIQQDMGRRRWQPEPDPGSEEAIDLISQQQLRVDRAIKIPGPRLSYDELNAEQDSIHLESRVTSTYSARPVNGFDTLFGGTVVAGVICTQVTAAFVDTMPNPDKLFVVGDGPGSFAEAVFSPRTIDGCTINAGTFPAQSLRLSPTPPAVWVPSGPWVINFVSVDSGAVVSINIDWFGRDSLVADWTKVASVKNLEVGFSFTFDVQSNIFVGTPQYQAVFTGFAGDDVGGINITMDF